MGAGQVKAVTILGPDPAITVLLLLISMRLAGFESLRTQGNSGLSKHTHLANLLISLHPEGDA